MCLKQLCFTLLIQGWLVKAHWGGRWWRKQNHEECFDGFHGLVFKSLLPIVQNGERLFSSPSRIWGPSKWDVSKHWESCASWDIKFIFQPTYTHSGMCCPPWRRKRNFHYEFCISTGRHRVGIMLSEASSPYACPPLEALRCVLTPSQMQCWMLSAATYNSIHSIIWYGIPLDRSAGGGDQCRDSMRERWDPSFPFTQFICIEAYLKNSLLPGAVQYFTLQGVFIGLQIARRWLYPIHLYPLGEQKFSSVVQTWTAQYDIHRLGWLS